MRLKLLASTEIRFTLSDEDFNFMTLNITELWFAMFDCEKIINLSSDFCFSRLYLVIDTFLSPAATDRKDDVD